MKKRDIVTLFVFLLTVFYGFYCYAQDISIGNFTLHGDGTTTQQIGNSAFHSDGTTTQRMGNFYFHSDGTTSQQMGDFIFHSDDKIKSFQWND